jgi:hypothetical protein
MFTVFVLMSILTTYLFHSEELCRTLLLGNFLLNKFTFGGIKETDEGVN